jgi:hypothetical protein
MNTRSAHKFVNSLTVSLAVVCALYVALLLGTTLALNHGQMLHLNEYYVGRIWLPTNYAPDDGYDVPVSVILRDVRAEMIFGHVGTRVLDVLAGMAVMCLVLQLTVRFADRRQRLRVAPRPSGSQGSRPQASRPKPPYRPAPAKHTAVHPPLGKAAPYGDSRRTGPAKVLSFPKR